MGRSQSKKVSHPFLLRSPKRQTPLGSIFYSALGYLDAIITRVGTALVVFLTLTTCGPCTSFIDAWQRSTKRLANEGSCTIKQGPCAKCVRRSREDALVCSVDLGVAKEAKREVMNDTMP